MLARWSDDGWYYHGHVIKEGKHKCIVQDATGYHEGISKDDIIVEADHNFNVIQVNHVLEKYKKCVDFQQKLCLFVLYYYLRRFAKSWHVFGNCLRGFGFSVYQEI